MRLLTTTRQDADGTVRIRAVGEIDLDNAYQLREATDRVLTAGPARQIVIDLVSAPLIDSIGIGVLVSCYHAAAAFRVPLIVANPTPLVHRQLWVCGLAGLFGLPTGITTGDGAWLAPGEAGRQAGVADPSGAETG